MYLLWHGVCWVFELTRTATANVPTLSCSREITRAARAPPGSTPLFMQNAEFHHNICFVRRHLSQSAGWSSIGAPAVFFYAYAQYTAVVVMQLLVVLVVSMGPSETRL